MSAMSDLIEDWIPDSFNSSAATKNVGSNKTQGPVDIPDEMREMTVNHIKQWVADINSLLKEYTAHRL